MRTWLVSLAALVALAGTAFAQGYPTREVKIVVPFAPGGGTDGISRVLADKLSKQLGKPVIVENRGGAGSTIGMAAVAAAAPDGHTLVVNGDSAAILEFLFANLSFDLYRDFAPVAVFAAAPLILAAHPSFPANNMKEMIELAKKKPGDITYATPGVGTPQDLAGKLLAQKAQITVNEVTYRGGGPALMDVVAGHAQIGVFTATTVLPHIPTGRLKVLGVVGDHRTALAPELPSMAEAGLPGVDAHARYVMLAPAATPRVVIDRLYAAFAAVMKDPDTVAAFHRQGYEALISTPDETAAMLRAERDRWGPVLKAANVVPQ